MTASLEVITGSMFSGKSEELIRRVKRAKLAKRDVIVFKHSFDNRYAKNEVVSHNKNTTDAYPVSTVEEMKNVLSDILYYEIVAIDEAQFFGEEIVAFIDELVNRNIRVIVAGLDLDFKGEPFYPMPIIMAKADKIDKLKAICTISGEPAWCSQRLINGEPAYDDDPLVVVGATESYEARSRRYHYVRKRNKPVSEIHIIISTVNREIEEVKKILNIDNLVDVDVKKPLDFIKKLETRVLKEKYNAEYVDEAYYLNTNLLYKLSNNFDMLKLLSQYSKYMKVSIISKKNSQKINYIKKLFDINEINNINEIII